MAKTVLERAKRAFTRRRYSDVITILEPEILTYRDSFPYYYYLGLSCLHTGDVGGASSYFQRARQIRMRDPDLLAAQAALYLRRGDTHQAVEYYLEALEYAPGHRLARGALEFIRAKGDAETIAALVETGKIARFYPRPKGFRVPLPAIVVLLVILCVTAVIRFVGPAITDAAASGARADLTAIELAPGERRDPVELGGTYRYILTEAQVIDAYANARRHFQSYRDNAAQVEINRILSSNAQASIKQKARLLMSYLAEPRFDTVTDVPSYAEVSADVPLYLDCWVLWKGMATNLRQTDSTLSFDFLVGYHTRDKLEGVVPVSFASVIPVDPERPLEVLARVSTDGGKLVLKGGGIHQAQAAGSQ